jgi:hypothetical protein
MISSAGAWTNIVAATANISNNSPPRHDRRGCTGESSLANVTAVFTDQRSASKVAAYGARGKQQVNSDFAPY